ncbi:hypothetical protein LZ30DRAFT_199835 [Colletotrichum cereale]|nr:hypothetical protein LZ30DRAFT_199835 [Colletotrichum cereale]
MNSPVRSGDLMLIFWRHQGRVENPVDFMRLVVAQMTWPLDSVTTPRAIAILMNSPWVVHLDDLGFLEREKITRVFRCMGYCEGQQIVVKQRHHHLPTGPGQNQPRPAESAPSQGILYIYYDYHVSLFEEGLLGSIPRCALVKRPCQRRHRFQITKHQYAEILHQLRKIQSLSSSP